MSMKALGYLLYALIFLSTFIAIFNIFLRRQKTSLMKLAEDKAVAIRDSEDMLAWQYRKRTILLRRGADFFILKDGFSLTKWYLDKLLVSGVFTAITVFLNIIFATGATVTVVSSIIVAFAAFFSLDTILYMQNKSSNREMMNDIMEMSRSVLYSNRGGQYITKALSDAMLVVENDRLKVALLRLKYNIDSNRPLSNAMDEFESHFENAEISAFCTVIKSLQETGQVNDALTTLRSNIEREQVAVNKRKCDQLENRTQINCILIFVGIVLCLVYMLFVFIGNIISGF